MKEIIDKVIEEKNRQEKLWGVQQHPSVRGTIPAIHYNIPTMEEAKEMCDYRTKTKEVSWADIALEEFCEILEAPNEEQRQEEIVQLIAVLFSQYEAIEKSKVKV